MANFRLIRAPNADADASREKFKRFIEQQKSKFVTARSDDVIRSAIEDQSLFFVLDEESNIRATSAIYWHDEQKSGWAEIGSTLVDEAYRGMGLQRIIYCHIISLKWLSDYPGHFFAVVDEGAKDSYLNIEKLDFERLPTVPRGLVHAKPNRDWSPISDGSKRFYQLRRSGIRSALLFAAETANKCRLITKGAPTKHTLSIDFGYLKSPNAKELLLEEADTLI